MVILALDPQFSIDLQLIGGVIILQTLPAIVIGLYTRAAHAWGLLAGCSPASPPACTCSTRRRTW